MSDNLVATFINLLDRIYTAKKDIFIRKRGYFTSKDGVISKKTDEFDSQDDGFTKKLF